MLIAIIGGRTEDEQHLARIGAKAGLSFEFCRPGSAQSANGLVAALDAWALADLDLSRGDEERWRVTPRALVFDAEGDPELAGQALEAVRRDPYFERVGAIVVVAVGRATDAELPGRFDDFLIHPFTGEELWIRLRALSRRRKEAKQLAARELDGLVIDETTRDVYVGGRAVQLTEREFALFTYLCEWRGKVLSREQLLARVWGSRYSGGRRTVDIHVRRLRAKLGSALPLETLRGRGYRLQHVSARSGAPLGLPAPHLGDARLMLKSPTHSRTFPAEPAVG